MDTSKDRAVFTGQERTPEIRRFFLFGGRGDHFEAAILIQCCFRGLFDTGRRKPVAIFFYFGQRPL